MPRKRKRKLECPECGEDMVLRESRRFGKFYGCSGYPACTCTHGAHQDTGEPLGVPADAETRQARKEAHEVFDAVWKADNKKGRRYRAYGWLAKEMGMTRDKCHIGRFNIEQCKQVIVLSKRRLERL